MTMSNPHKIIATMSGTYNDMDWEADYEITYNYRRGTRDSWSPSWGWLPGDPSEVELVSVKPLIGVLDHGAFTDLAQDHINAWAQDFLEDDKNSLVSRTAILDNERTEDDYY
jgi:hypothetical protein